MGSTLDGPAQKRLLTRSSSEVPRTRRRALSSWLGRPVTADRDRRGRRGRPGRGLRSPRPGRRAGRRLLDGAARAAHRAAPPRLRGPLRAGPGRPAAPPAARHGDGLGRARAVGRQRDGQHRRLCLSELAGRPPPPTDGDLADADATILPSPPSFRHEFAASLLEFALMDQALEARPAAPDQDPLRGRGQEARLVAPVRPEQRIARMAGLGVVRRMRHAFM